MFHRDALLLIGHGSARAHAAAKPLEMHAETIRASGKFAEVGVGMLRGEPALDLVFDELKAPIVHVLPYFLEDGFFTRIVIPDLLLPKIGDSRLLRFCKPIGTNPGIGAMIEARLTRYCDTYGVVPSSLSVLLVGHGSSRNPGRARALKQHAARLEAGRLFASVRVAHLEEAPLVPDVLAGNRGQPVAIIGYLANDGVHASEDLPRLIAMEREIRGTAWPPVHDLGSIGTDEALPRMMLDQVTTLV